MNEMTEKIVKCVVILGIASAIFGSAIATASANQFMTLPVADKTIQIWKYVDTSEHTLTYPGHEGTDYNTGEGMDVVAVADGTAYPHKDTEGDGIDKDKPLAEGGLGYFVDIDHGNGYWTRYAHMHEEGRASGAVKRGDVIGKSSNSGSPWFGFYGTHLHFEVRSGGEWGTVVDPYGTESWLWIGDPPKSFVDVATPPVLLRYYNSKNPSDPLTDRIYLAEKDAYGNFYKHWIIHEQAFKDQWYYNNGNVKVISIDDGEYLNSPFDMMIPGENIIFKDGTLIEKNDGTIFKIQNGEKRGFTSWQSYLDHGYNANTPRLKVSDTVANAVPTGVVMGYRLLKTSDNPNVYLIQGNEKKLVPNIELFNFWNLDWAKLETVSQVTLNQFTDKGSLNYIRYGTLIGSPNGIDVYFVSIDDNGNFVKRYIPNQQVLSYLGGSTSSVRWLTSTEFESIPAGYRYDYQPLQAVIVEPSQNCQDCHTPPTPAPTPTPTSPPSSPPSTPTPTPSPVSETIELGWRIEGADGSAGNSVVLREGILLGKESVTITWDAHGLCLLGSDASAIAFEQGEWRFISLSDYGENCKDGEQTKTIYLSDFKGLDSTVLDPNSPIGQSFIGRIWHGGPFAVDIYRVRFNAIGESPTPTPMPSPTPETIELNWRIEGADGSAGDSVILREGILLGKESVTITWDAHGLCLLGSDASAIAFEQGEWRFISLSDYGENCKDGEQTKTIYLSDFKGLDSTVLDPNSPIGQSFIGRIWHGGPFAVDIYRATFNP